MKNIKELKLKKEQFDIMGKSIGEGYKSFIEVVNEQTNIFYRVSGNCHGEHIFTHYYTSKQDATHCKDKWTKRECNVSFKEVKNLDCPCSYAWNKQGEQILTDRYLNENKKVDWDINNIKYFEHN